MAYPAVRPRHGNVLYETTIQKGWVNSAKHYYIRVRIEAFAGDRLVLAHDYDCRDKEVLIQLPVGTLGDSVGWFSYAVKFPRARGCRLSVAMAEFLIPLFRDAYPEINFLTHEQVDPKRYYATYNIGLFFDDEERIHQPCDFRLVGLHRTAGYILGVDPTEEAPRIAPSRSGRPIAERYVCMAVQSTHSGEILEQSVRLAGDHPLSQRGRLPRGLHRPQPGERPGADLEPHPARRAGRDRRPSARRARALAQATRISSLVSPAAWLGWPGRSASRW